MRRALDAVGVFPSNPQLAKSLQATTNNVKDSLPECAGLSISLVREQTRTFTFVRSDTLTGVLDAMQYLDDGPCEKTVRSGEEIRIDDVFAEVNWPLFARASAAAGIRSTLSLPLRRGPHIVGSVNVYGDTPHAFTGKEAALADVFGVHVQHMISNADLSLPPATAYEEDPEVQKERAVVDQALGILAVQHSIPSETVEQRLADAAARARTSILDVARAIILSAEV